MVVFSWGAVLSGVPHTEENPQKMAGVMLAPGYEQKSELTLETDHVTDPTLWVGGRRSFGSTYNLDFLRVGFSLTSH